MFSFIGDDSPTLYASCANQTNYRHALFAYEFDVIYMQNNDGTSSSTLALAHARLRQSSQCTEPTAWSPVCTYELTCRVNASRAHCGARANARVEEVASPVVHRTAGLNCWRASPPVHRLLSAAAAAGVRLAVCCGGRGPVTRDCSVRPAGSTDHASAVTAR